MTFRHRIPHRKTKKGSKMMEVIYMGKWDARAK